MESDCLSYDSCEGAGERLARLRGRASRFFESLSVAELARPAHRHQWISDWLRVAADYGRSAQAARAEGAARTMLEAWVCSLTALEVARSLSCPGDPVAGDLAGKIGDSLRDFEDDAGPVIERVKLDGFERESPPTGFFLPALRHGRPAPVVICVADDHTAMDSMMSRILSASCGRTMSILLVDVGTSPLGRSFKPEHLLQCWLQYLEARPDVDSRRIAVYGEGAGASHASRLALLDRRIAAAVCDGGIATPVMRRASLRWMIGAEQAGTATEPLLPSRRIPCPLLVVVGSRSMVWEEDALELNSGYRQAGADCATVVPNRIPHPLGEVENFVAVDDFIFQWLDSKLGEARQLAPVTYL